MTDHQSEDTGSLLGPSASERRNRSDRRTHLERAAGLASLVNNLRTLCDAEARELTIVAKQVELLRTPTAPSVQHVAALQRAREAIGLLVTVADRFRADLDRVAECVEDEVAALARTSAEPGATV